MELGTDEESEDDGPPPLGAAKRKLESCTDEESEDDMPDLVALGSCTDEEFEDDMSDLVHAWTQLNLN